MYEFHELRTTSIQIDSKERRLMKQRKLIQLQLILCNTVNSYLAYGKVHPPLHRIKAKLERAHKAWSNLFEFTTYSTLLLDWI